MATLTVTPAQAQHLAALSQQVQQAQQTYLHALTLLSLGHAVGELQTIDVDTGTLTFADLPTVELPEGVELPPGVEILGVAE